MGLHQIFISLLSWRLANRRKEVGPKSKRKRLPSSIQSQTVTFCWTFIFIIFMLLGAACHVNPTRQGAWCVILILWTTLPFYVSAPRSMCHGSHGKGFYMPSVWWTVVLKFQMHSPRFIASKASVRSCKSMVGALSCVNDTLFSMPRKLQGDHGCAGPRIYPHRDPGVLCGKVAKGNDYEKWNVVYIDMIVIYIYIHLLIYVYAVFPPARHAFEATLMYWLPCGTCAIYFCADVHSYNARAFKQDRFRKVDASSFLWLSTSRWCLRLPVAQTHEHKEYLRYARSETCEIVMSLQDPNADQGT